MGWYGVPLSRPFTRLIFFLTKLLLVIGVSDINLFHDVFILLFGLSISYFLLITGCLFLIILPCVDIFSFLFSSLGFFITKRFDLWVKCARARKAKKFDLFYHLRFHKKKSFQKKTLTNWIFVRLVSIVHWADNS